MKKAVYLSVDLESGGSHFDNDDVAVGFFVGEPCDITDDGEPREIERRRFVLPYKVSTFEERCKKEFWDKNPILLENLGPSPYNTKDEAWKDIARYLDDLHERYYVTILSDNPAFDIGRIDHNLYWYAGRLPMRYTPKGDYRPVSDPSEQLKMCPYWFQKEFKRRFKHLHSHFPEEDAEYIYTLQFYCDSYRFSSGFLCLLDWKLAYFKSWFTSTV